MKYLVMIMEDVNGDDKGDLYGVLEFKDDDAGINFMASLMRRDASVQELADKHKSLNEVRFTIDGMKVYEDLLEVLWEKNPSSYFMTDIFPAQGEEKSFEIPTVRIFADGNYVIFGGYDNDSYGTEFELKEGMSFDELQEMFDLPICSRCHFTIPATDACLIIDNKNVCSDCLNQTDWE